MRDRRLLSARGHPDRLRGRRKSEGQAGGEKDKKKGDEESECEGIERREEKEVSEEKSRMQGIPRSLRRKRTDGKK